MLSSESDVPVEIKAGDHCKILVNIRSARSFVDFVSADDCRDRELQLHASFLSQRWWGKPVEASVDPQLECAFQLDLPVPARASPSTLIDLETPLVLVLTARRNPPSGEAEVLCYYLHSIS